MMKRTSSQSNARTLRRAFSLIEVLLAIFILGIGAISIAAIFPAGIVQQRQTVDDMLGATVANNALEIIRAKVSQSDFGTFEQFGATPFIVTVPGDWPWSRPAFFTGTSTLGPVIIPEGSISIFNGGFTNTTDTEIPYNAAIYSAPPDFVITQGERYYPQASINAVYDTPPRPEYVWDCMFRRFEGRVYVAIFVYRVAIPNVGAFTYVVPENPTSPNIPPVPILVELRTPPERWDTFGPDLTYGTEDDAYLPGTNPGTAYNPNDNAQQWQAPGQWILDQNNNVHRVLFGRENEDQGPVILQRPVPGVPALPVFSSGTSSVEDVVTHIWYMPRNLYRTIGGVRTEISITPVYVMVREL